MVLKENAGVRTFIAFELHPGIRAALAVWQGELRFRRSKIRWVREANLHLTLQFLGAVDGSRLPAVAEAAERAAVTLRPFWMEVGGVGAFPDWRKPRVIWAGLTQARAEARESARCIEEELARAGFPRESKAFTPHVTLGRVKSWQGGTPPERLLHGVAGAMSVDRITVMRSDLRPEGPVYTPLFVYRFISGEVL